MVMTKAVASDIDELLAAFLKDFPDADPTAVRPRFERGYALWKAGAVYHHDTPSGCWKVRVEHPERTRPGESTWYWARTGGRAAKCDCADYGFRGVPCKHIAAAFLVEQEHRTDYEAWCAASDPAEAEEEAAIARAEHLYDQTHYY